MCWLQILLTSENRNGECSTLLIHSEGQIYALDSRCPRVHLPLKGATVEGTALTCPWHHSAFDLRTGDVQDRSPLLPDDPSFVLRRVPPSKFARISRVCTLDGIILKG